MLCKMAGHRCGKRVPRITDDPERPRPGADAYRLTENTLFDVRTAVGGDSRYCRQAGQLPGFGAQWGAHEKNKKRLCRLIRQGDQFIPPVHEAGGIIFAPALDFLNTLAAATAGSRSSGHGAIMAFALQRLRLVTSRGATAVPLRSPVLRNGPEIEPSRGALPLGPPPPRPAQQGCVHQEHQRSEILEAAILYSGLVDVSLPGMARRTSYSTNIYTNFQTAEIMPRTSERAGRLERGGSLFPLCT